MDNPYPICENCIFVDEPLDKDPCQECNRAFLAQRIKPNFVSKRKPKTNADRIRSMSDEELAEWLAEVLFHCSNTICDERCPMYKCCCDQPSDNIEDWLKKETIE